MPKSSRVASAVVLSAAVVAGALAAPAVAGPVVPPPPAARGKLDAHDEHLLQDARRAGRTSVTVIVAAAPGRTAQAAAQLTALGARVTRTSPDIGYVKATVPVDTAAKAAAQSAVQALDVDSVTPLDDPQPDSSTDPLRQPPPSRKTPRVNAYLPTGDIGAAQYATQPGGPDGRGTTIAVLDTGVDLGSAPLTKTSTGLRKIVGWYDAIAPTDGDGGWVPVTGSYTGAFTLGGRTWTAPSSGGPYAFGVFSETAGDLGHGDVAGDVNRDGDRNDSWGVLEDPAAGTVRVDLDGDGDFTDEAPMTDYAAHFDTGYFGTDDPATPVVERMPFVVQTDHAGYVGIGIPSGVHGSHVAGIAAGHALFGGAVSGGAPGAKLMSVKVCLTTGCPDSGLVDGVLYAAQHGADVVNISIGGLPGLNDGDNARAELYNRTIAQYNVQIVISAGNDGPGLNTVGDPGVATDALTVGASVSADTWLADFGARVGTSMCLAGFSSRGPREDGGFKPDVVAPGMAVSTIPTWLPGRPISGTYALPPGYGMLSGTSMAAPEVAGAAALLIGSWKATHRGARPSVLALRTALKSTARPLAGVPVYAQGAGLVDVAAAASVLAAAPAPDVVTTAVPVSTVFSAQLATPGVGVGIHDREGVRLGRSYTRTYTLTRTTGAAGVVQFGASWVGDDGTFTSPGAVKLPLGTAVPFKVTITPSAAGVHSALLRLDNRATAGIDVQTLNTVVVPAAGAVGFSDSGTIVRAQALSRFVTVPVGATAMTVRLTGGGGPGRGAVRFLRFHPGGFGIDGSGSYQCYNPDDGTGCPTGSPTARTLTDPAPGVWEIVVQASWRSDVETMPWSLDVSILSTSVNPDPDAFTAPLGGVVTRTQTVSNAGAGFTGRLVGGPLTSAAIARPSIGGGGQQQQHAVTVPAGTTALTAAIGNAADPQADLDLYAYDCTTGSCVAVASSGGIGATESVRVDNPAPGQWIVLVVGYTVPSGSTAFDYVDTLAVPGLGAVTTSDADAFHARGTSWQPGVQVQVQGATGGGRVLLGTTSVVTKDGTRVGGGRVVVTVA